MLSSIKKLFTQRAYRIIDSKSVNCRHYLLDFTIAFYFFAFSIVFAVSLLRVYDTGWQENNFIHTLLLFLMAALFLRRKHTPYFLKVSTLILIAYVIGITISYQLGISPSSYLYYAISIMLSATFYSMRITLWVLLSVIMTQLILMYLTATGEISYQISPLISINSVNFWITHLVAFIVLVATPLIKLGWLNTELSLSQNKLLVSNKELMNAKKKLELQATTDELTSLPNRRAFYSYAQATFKKFKRNQSSFSVLMMDLDYFKKINDNYGHDAGDNVLIAMAKIFMEQIREYDLVARTGGEEFVAVLIDITPEKSLLISERIRQAIKSTTVEVNGMNIEVTISIGLAHAQNNDNSFDGILKRADKALYQAKENGRDRVAEIAF